MAGIMQGLTQKVRSGGTGWSNWVPPQPISTTGTPVQAAVNNGLGGQVAATPSVQLDPMAGQVGVPAAIQVGAPNTGTTDFYNPGAAATTPQQGIVNDMMSGQAYSPYREQANEAQARYERDLRATGAARINQAGFGGQGLGDQMANTTESGLARQRFDTNAQLNVGEQATKERGAGIAMEQGWKALDWAAVNGSDADFVAAYEKATGQKIDPMSVSQYRGYARTLAQQQIDTNKLNLESGQSTSLSGWLQAKIQGNAGYDWTSDSTAVKKLGDLYTSQTGKTDLASSDFHNWADQYVKSATVDPTGGKLNDLNNQPWYQQWKTTNPDEATRFEQDIVASTGLIAGGHEALFDDSGKLVGWKNPDGTMDWGVDPAETATDAAFTTFSTAYQTKYPDAEPVDQDTYDAIEEDLGEAPTAEQYNQMAPEVQANQAFDDFNTSYAKKYGAAATADRDTYDAIQTELGEGPTLEQYKTYAPIIEGTYDVSDLKGDPTAIALAKKDAPTVELTQYSLSGTVNHGINKFVEAPAKGAFFTFNGTLYKRTGSFEENVNLNINQQFFSATRINDDGTTTNVWIQTPSQNAGKIDTAGGAGGQIDTSVTPPIKVKYKKP